MLLINRKEVQIRGGGGKKTLCNEINPIFHKVQCNVG